MDLPTTQDAVNSAIQSVLAWAGTNPFTTFFLTLTVGGISLIFLFVGGTADNPVHFFLRVVVRMVWRVIKLAFKVIFAGLLTFVVAGWCLELLSPKPKSEPIDGGPEGEKFYTFMNSVTWIPQQIWYALIGVLQILAFVALTLGYAVGGLIYNHSTICEVAAAIAFLLWFDRALREEIQKEEGIVGRFERALQEEKIQREKGIIPPIDSAKKAAMLNQIALGLGIVRDHNEVAKELDFTPEQYAILLADGREKLGFASLREIASCKNDQELTERLAQGCSGPGLPNLHESPWDRNRGCRYTAAEQQRLLSTYSAAPITKSSDWTR